jgi:hypothetical protein
MPMTVYGTPLSRIGRPTISRLPPKRRCQKSWPSIATFAAPARSSSTWKPRPSGAATPSVGRRFAVARAPRTTSGSPSPERLNRVLVSAASPSNDRTPARQSRKSGSEAVSRPIATCRPQTITRRSGSGYGSGRSSTPLTMLKMAVVAPMPIASVATTAMVNPGLRRSERSA